MTYSIGLLELLISLGALCYLVFGPVARLVRDNTRSNVRRIREDLFTFMLENGFDFANPAYQTTRQTLNGMLRRINVMTVTDVLATMRHAPGGDEPSVFNEIDKQDDKLKKELHRALHMAVSEVFRFVFLKRPLGLLFTALIFGGYGVCIFVRWCMRQGHSTYKTLIEKPSAALLAAAYKVGSQNQPATS